METNAFRLSKQLTPRLRAGDISGCEAKVVKALRSLPKTPFHIAPDLAITSSPAEAAEYFDEFYDVESRRFAVKAVYTEMNGFDINPGLWYCSPFAYTSDGGLKDFDWLSDWQSEDFGIFTITGLEQLQSVYASDAFSDKANDLASELSSLLVVTKFQRFMQLAVEQMSTLKVPLYVTAHDYDHIARFVPGE